MLLAIDQGTTGTTSLVFDLQGELIGRAYREFTQHFPRPGWVEHDAAEIWEVSHAVAGEALEDAGVRPGELEAVGITNQRETVVCWDPSTGEPLHRALVWQDRRTAARCDELREAGRGARAPREHRADPRPVLLGDEDRVAAAQRRRARAAGARGPRGVRDGRRVDAVQAHGRVRDRAQQRLADAADATSAPAAGTRSCSSLFGVPERALPAVRPVAAASSAARAPTRSTATRCRSPASPATSRRRCSASAASSPGSARTPTAPARSCCSTPARGARRPRPGLLSTIAWQIGRSTTYALEAAIFVTGAAVQWLRDGLGIIEQAAETEALAASLDSNDGVYFVPALTGLGSPHWDPYARGTIVGLTRGSGARAPRARGARGDGLPDGRRGPGDGGAPAPSRSPSCAPTAARRSTAG